jgi:riboflavin kinase / FMN adenylyltransferase
MQILGSGRELRCQVGPFAVGIGIFDGVHLGHQQLLQLVTQLGRQSQIRSLAYTFHPHPARILNREHAPKLIEPLAERLERLAALGLDATLVEPFDEDFAAITAPEFVRTILVERLAVQHVVVGENFTFGQKAAGDFQLLADLGRSMGFVAHRIAVRQSEGRAISSTAIRAHVDHGRVEQATALLGRPFVMSGLVIRGAGRGAEIGTPTANLLVENELCPKTGIYATLASGTFGQDVPAVTNVGYSPTFGLNPLRIETHVIDHALGALYGQALRVTFVARLRDEIRFADVATLVTQIRRDIDQARVMLKLPAPRGSDASTRGSL